MIIHKKLNKKKLILLSALIAAVFSVSYLLYAKQNNLVPFESPDEYSLPGESKVSLEKSDTEKKRMSELEKNPSLKSQNNQTDRPDQPDEVASGKARVNVLLTNVSINEDRVSASGFVTNLAESGGSCTYVFSSGTSEVVKSANTLVNPTSTTCETVTFPVIELTPGKWKVLLKYNSENAEGVSNQKEVAT